MRNRFFGIALAVLSILSMAACKDDNGGPVTPTTAEKTIFFYMPWTDSETSTGQSLYSYFLANINNVENGISSQNGLGRNRVLVFISPSPTYSALLEIKYSGGRCIRDTLKRYSRIDYTAPEGIAAILNDVKANAEAHQYDMIIGSHANGWIPKGMDNYYRTRAFGGSTSRYQTNIADLAAGISRAGMHMQFICFDDCYMAQVEVAYDLRQVADYLIASTSEVLADGIPYDEVWKYITPATPDYEKICQTFHQHYMAYTYPYGTLSTIKCAEMENMAAIMKNLNANYTFDTGKLGDLQKLDGYGQTAFFDFADYVKALCGGTVPPEFTAALNRLVPYYSYTPQIYTDLDEYNGGFNTVPVNTFSGITISDPTDNTYLEGYKTQTNWWLATH
ncbi:clostripain-related cysteine peptidase [Prevotella sp. KH2C16]|uniref:clostripain-related cysteine peptidase n=1 Tax=Prevotella sp. KH2C16 TaxID=1855325 RepID=UPI0008E9B60D|nr:clostripain-related cysteine peptidase [Prevotella sp. KH2C16]SFF98523.1 hypothetical protein SAMN05216383_103111 [Prevotella sp. KH2C16]